MDKIILFHGCLNLSPFSFTLEVVIYIQQHLKFPQYPFFKDCYRVFSICMFSNFPPFTKCVYGCCTRIGSFSISRGEFNFLLLWGEGFVEGYNISTCFFLGNWLERCTFRNNCDLYPMKRFLVLLKRIYFDQFIHP